MNDTDKTLAIARAMGLEVELLDGVVCRHWGHFTPLEGGADGAAMWEWLLIHYGSVMKATMAALEYIDMNGGNYADDLPRRWWHAIGDAVIAVAGGEHA